jgi:hypothetical protein
MYNKQFIWPKTEKIVFLRPPNEKYNGSLDSFYSPDLFPELALLKENWQGIRDEVLEYEKKNGALASINALSAPETSGEGKWSLIYLSCFNYKYHKNRSKFPFISSVIDQIPNCVLAGISMLPPYTQIKPHFGDTNAIVRTHLALVIPAEYPIIAIKVGEEERGWKEGELLCFINVNKHSVWNNSCERRYVLMFDFVPKILEHKTMEICTKGWGYKTFIFLYENSVMVRMMPNFIQEIMCSFFTLLWRIYLPMQIRFKVLDLDAKYSW